MSTTLGNLPCRRYVAQVSTGAPRIKSNWQAMQAENLEALKSPAWREAGTPTASLADHDFTAATHLNDAYDAFKMTGNYDATAMTEIGYAGMVAYRFKLPDDYVTGSANITSISVPVYRDRFCKGGVRLALAFGGSSPGAFGWAEARGEGADVAPKTALMAQSDEDAPYLTASSAADDVAEFELSPLAEKSTYLWLFLTLEDYEDGWEWYNRKEKRLYSIEGSARLAGELVSVSFDADVTPDAAEHEFAVVRGGVVPMLPEGSASGVRKIELFRTGDEIVPSFTDLSSDPAYTVVEFDGHATEFLGRAADANVSIPFELGGATTRIVAVCGAFERASIPGVPGLVLIDAATGAILQATVSGTLDGTLAALLNTAASKVGVTIDTSGTDPTALVYAASATQFSGNPFISLNLSTLVASDAGMSATAMSFQTDEVPVRFYDRSLLYEDSSTSPQYALVPLFCVWNFPATTDSGVTVAQLVWTPHSAWRARKSSSPETSMLSVAAYGADPRIDWIGVTGDGEYSGNGTTARRSLTVVGSYAGLGRTSLATGEVGASGATAAIPSPVLDECATGFVRVDASMPSGYNNATATALDPGMAAGPLVRLEQEEYGGTKYLAYGGYYQAGGDPALRYALEYDAELGTRTALGASCAPYAAFALGGKFGVARARVGSARQDYYFAEDLPAAPTAANSAIGLRTLQGKFYLGQAEAVARATRARIGAAYSVRAGTRTLKVVTAGAAADTAVPVWRLFASALAVPFAVPTEWRARALRLDWTDWAGTATAGARFNVWIKAGHWQDASPQALEGDAPYDALAAEADGWTLLGTVDATLAGVARTATFEAAALAGAKVASLMLTAYAPTDGINPADGTAWPVGAGTEVDLSGGEVANAAKAWLPDVTLVG